MKVSLFLVASSAMLLVTASAAAQSSGVGGVRPGLGLEIGSERFVSAPSLYRGQGAPLGYLGVSVPVRMNNLRLELQLGGSRREASTSTSEEQETQLSGGISAFMVKRTQTKLELLFGAKATYVSRSEKETQSPEGGDSTETTLEDSWLAVGPMVGMEYFLSKHFTLGAELGVRYGLQLSADASSEDPNTTARVPDDSSHIFTEASLQARWYY